MMVCLAGEKKVVTSRELEQKIRFPQQSIFSAGRKLKNFGFISTVHGPFGGYVLARPPEDITIQEILLAFQDEFDISNETSLAEASTLSLQNFARKLVTVKGEIDRQLSFTLADLLKETV